MEGGGEEGVITSSPAVLLLNLDFLTPTGHVIEAHLDLNIVTYLILFFFLHNCQDQSEAKRKLGVR